MKPRNGQIGISQKESNLICRSVARTFRTTCDISQFGYGRWPVHFASAETLSHLNLMYAKRIINSNERPAGQLSFTVY